MRKMQEARTGRAKLNLPPLADGCVRLRYLPPPLASAIFHPPLSLPHRSPEARSSYRALVALPSPRPSPSPQPQPTLSLEPGLPRSPSHLPHLPHPGAALPRAPRPDRLERRGPHPGPHRQPAQPRGQAAGGRPRLLPLPGARARARARVRARVRVRVRVRVTVTVTVTVRARPLPLPCAPPHSLRALACTRPPPPCLRPPPQAPLDLTVSRPHLLLISGAP